MSIPPKTKGNLLLSRLAVLFAFFCAATSNFAQSLTFSLGYLYAGSGAATVLPIDVNNTGFPGLVCANYGFNYDANFGEPDGGGSTLSVWANDGFGNLSASSTLNVGHDPVGLAVADVNGDGWPDIICGNVGDNTITVLTNNHHGNFVAGTPIHVGEGPVFVTAADVNGDGKVDLITANYQQDTLTVLTNIGNGTFKICSTVAVGTGPSCVATGDVNGDGNIDLICANSGSSIVEVFTNNGRGTFNQSANISVASGASWVVGTDVDGNGSIDFVTAYGQPQGNSTLSIYTNNGAGKFSLKSTATAYAGAGMIYPADLNGDGKIDLVCQNNGNFIQGSMEVLTNDGAGNFSSNVVVDVGSAPGPNYPNFVTAADFNGDGNIDVAVSCYFTNAGTVSTVDELLQIDVQPKPIVAITSPANDAVVTTNASIPLAVSAKSGNTIEVVVYYVLGNNYSNAFASTNSPFGLTIPAETLRPGTYAIKAEAVDSKGHIGWSPEVQLNVTGPVVHVTPSAPLTFSKSNVKVGSGPLYVLPIDLNGNGSIDLVTANYGFTYENVGCIEEFAGAGSNLTFCVNNGHGVFTSNYSVTVASFLLQYGYYPQPSCVTGADFDNDGKLELVTTCQTFPELPTLTNNAKGIFSAANAVLPGGRESYFVTNADFNGDGRKDLVSANYLDSDLTVVTNTGNFTFSNSATLHVPDAPVWIAVADVNGDGRPDLISANYGECGSGNTLTVFTNAGNGNFATNATLTVGYGPVCVVAVDVNGDGFVDLVSANQDNTVTVLTNDGFGNFTLKSSFPVFSPTSMVAADLAGNGKMDLAIANGNYYTDGTITIFLNDGAGDFTSNTTVNVGYENETNNPSNIQAADVNGDGVVDLIVANYQSSSVTILTQTKSSQQPAPTITITSPANGAALLTTASLTITTTVTPTKNVVGVEFFLDGVLLGTSTSAPYSWMVPAGSLSVGGHDLQAVALNSNGPNGTSAVVQVTANTPGTALIDFDPLNTSAGAVGGSILANYLAPYGVTLANVTFGTAMEAVDTNSFTSGVQVLAPSSPNIFTQAGLNQPVSFTLRFATNLQAFGFTRAGLDSSSGLTSHPQWTATALDVDGAVLSSVTEALINTPGLVPEKSFVLTGNGIAAVRFDSDNKQTAAFSAVLLDNLLLNYNAVTPALSVALTVISPATNDIIAPATITLGANVSDQLSANYEVSFFAGPNLLGTVTSAPYQLTVTGVLPGNYALQARATDLSSGISAQSAVVPITVQLEANSTLVNFDSLNASRAPVETTTVENYLAGFGLRVVSLTPQTQLTVDRQQHIAGGNAVLAASPPNLLTQTGSSGPVQYALSFNPLLTQFGFTRPELLANPFVSHPAWQVTAFDGSGAIIGQAGEAEIDSSTNVGAREFSLGQPGGPGIAQVQFASQGSGLTTFNAMLADNFILTTNTTAFPPAVSITSPASGLVLPRPPALNVTAAAFDPKGIASVTFYANGFNLGTDTASPYTAQWPAPRPGNFALTAVAVNNLGLSTTSAVVNVTIQPSANQFAIVSQPVSQTVAAGGSATFSVGATGTNHLTYQWYFNGKPIAGANASSYVLPPPATDANAGSYTVQVISPGETNLSTPAVLTVVDPPAIRGPFGATVSAGTDVDLGVISPGATSFQWLLNGNPIPGATARTYTIPAAQPRQSGNYQVVVANQAASTVSAVAPVIVETAINVSETNTNFANRVAINPLLGPISDSNDLATVQKGAPLPDNLPGGNSIWFTWQPDFTGAVTLTTQGSDFETVMAVYTGTALNNLKPIAADEGSGGYLTSLVTFNVTAGAEYIIAVDGYQGQSGRVVLGFPAGTGYRVLSPSSGASVPIITRNPVNQVAAAGARVSMSVGISPATANCQWFFQGVQIPGATGSTFVIPHITPASVGLYDVSVANAAGSVQSTLVNVQIAANHGGAPTYSGGRFVLSSNAPTPASLATEMQPVDLGGDTGGFSASQVFSTIGAVSEPGEPQPCGQVGGASEWFVYTAPGNGTMQVNSAGSTFNTVLGLYTGTGTSFASLEEQGCGVCTNYQEQPQPSIVLPNVTKGTKFYILVEGYQGASGVAQLQIGLGQPLTFRQLPASQAVTAGNNATFTAVAIGGTPLSYQWQLNGANLAGATKSSFTVKSAQNAAVGNYTVIASNIVGVVTSTPPAELAVQFAPAIVAGPSNETVTLGLPAKFTVEVAGINVKTNPLVCQWYFSNDVTNNMPIPKSTGLTLSIPATHWTNGGTYYVVVTNSYGSATSGTATLTLTDKTPPTVAITSPPNNFQTNRLFVTVTGTASDKAGVAAVEVAVNSNAFSAASGTTNWSAGVRLTAGANVISVYSTDVAGNSSSIVKRTIIYDTNGSAILGRDTQHRSLANAASSASETYSGLFYPISGVSRANAGFFTATMVSGTAGAFTANILIDSGSYPLVGEFDAAGDATSTVLRSGKTPLTISLHLDSGTNQITGFVSGTGWRSVLQASRSVLNAAANPISDQTGQFALVVPSGAAEPAGYLAISNTIGGATLVTGAFVDGASIFRAAPQTQSQAIPIYAPLYSGEGMFLAWISLTNSAAPANIGPAVWIGPGFTNLTDIIISQ